jgi:hypothetical protein
LRIEAAERQEERNKRTARQQLDRMDQMFGEDIGGMKERYRLLCEIEEGEYKIRMKQRRAKNGNKT